MIIYKKLHNFCANPLNFMYIACFLNEPEPEELPCGLFGCLAAGAEEPGGKEEKEEQKDEGEDDRCHPRGHTSPPRIHCLVDTNFNRRVRRSCLFHQLIRCPHLLAGGAASLARCPTPLEAREVGIGPGSVHNDRRGPAAPGPPLALQAGRQAAQLHRLTVLRPALASSATGRAGHGPPATPHSVAAADAAGVPAPAAPGAVLRAAAIAAHFLEVVGAAGTLLAAVLGRLQPLPFAHPTSEAAGGGAARLGPFSPLAVDGTGRSNTVPAGQRDTSAMFPVALEQLPAARLAGRPAGGGTAAPAPLGPGAVDRRSGGSSWSSS